MPDTNLRRALIRLAYSNPEVRREILGLLKTADEQAGGDADPKSHGQNRPEQWYGLQPTRPALGEPAPMAKTGRLHARQEAILRKYMEGQPPPVHALPRAGTSCPTRFGRHCVG